MNRGRIAGALFAIFLPLAAPAWAQNAAPPVAATLHVIHAQDAIVKPMAEWDVVQSAPGEQTGTRTLIAEGQEAVAKAPATASRYEARAYKFPTGTIRVLTFKKQPAGVIHQITYETEIYILQGEVTVDIAGKPTTLKTGDAAFLPGGIMRNKKPAGDTVVLQYFVNHTAQNPKAQVVRGNDLKLTETKVGTARWHVKRYNFDGNSIRLANMHKGGETPPGVQPRTDALLYVTKGRLRRTEDGEIFEVGPGDALREVVGKTGRWELLEESTFFGSDAPRPSGVPTPAPSGR